MLPHLTHSARRRHGLKRSGSRLDAARGKDAGEKGEGAPQATVTKAKATPSKRPTPGPRGLTYKNLPPQSMFGSMFQYLVNAPAWWSLTVLMGSLFAIALAFWAAYWTLASSDFSRGGEKSVGVDAACLLWYSVSTTTNLGDAPCTPDGSSALFLANIHALVVELALVYITGVVFTRMSKPGSHLSISKVLLINFDDENYGRCVKTRVFFDIPGARLIDVKFTLSYTRKITPSYLKTTQLSLVMPEKALLQVGTEIMHQITSADDEDSRGDVSPLVGETLNSIEEKSGWFTLTVIGTEEATMQTCFFTQTFKFKDGSLVDGEVFKLKDMGERVPEGGRVLNFGNLNEVIRIHDAPEAVPF